MTYFWPEGLAVQVINEKEANEKYCRSDGQTFGADFGLRADEVPRVIFLDNSQHQVEEIFSVWRVDIDWWRNRSWRTYFLAATGSGLLITIYQDLLSGNWYLQRLFD